MAEVSFIVTIDGPAASGKSSVSREITRRMNENRKGSKNTFGPIDWAWVSTGAFYRGLAYVAAEKKVDLQDEAALVRLANDAVWSVHLAVEETHVFLDNKDVTAEVGKEEVGSLASKISSLPKVRSALLNAQRACAQGRRALVAEGRDCGTVVFPRAPVKVFLTARAEDRAARRAKEENRDLTETIHEQKARDLQDSTRKTAPLQAPEGALVIDTTTLCLSQVVDRVEQLILEQLEI